MEYSRTFGSGKDSIMLVIVDEPMDKGLIGMVTSELFSRKIGLVQEQAEDDERDYSYACLRRSGKDYPWIYMEPFVVDALRNGDNFATILLLHEVGHYANGDFNFECERSSNQKRIELVGSDTISVKEVKADLFAAEYLGKDAVVAALQQLIEEDSRRYGDSETWNQEELQASIKEIELRIESLRAM